METIQIANENTPLLKNGTNSNEHEQLAKDFTLEISSEESHSPLNKEADSNEKELVLPVPKNDSQETNEVLLEEVVQALSSAYQRSGSFSGPLGLDCFDEKQLYKMHLAWKKITTGKLCSLKAHKIADAVAKAIAEEKHGRPPTQDPNDSIDDMFERHFHADKNILAANLLWKWETITEGSGFPLRYTRTIFDDSDESAPSASNFLIRLVDLYDKIRDFILNRNYQFILNSLLFIWPISILVIGSKHMECPMSHHLPYLMMMLGGIGCLATILQLALIHMSHGPYRKSWFLERNCLRFIHFSFLIVFIVQAVRLFSTNPVTEPDPNKCVESFYNSSLWINYVSIGFIAAFMFVYFIKVCLYSFDVANWIFKFL